MCDGEPVHGDKRQHKFHVLRGSAYAHRVPYARRSKVAPPVNATGVSAAATTTTPGTEASVTTVVIWVVAAVLVAVCFVALALLLRKVLRARSERTASELNTA